MSEKKWITITVPCSTEPCGFTYDSGGTCERQSATAVFACRGGVQINVRTRDVVTGIHNAWPAGEPADRAKRLAEIDARATAATKGPWEGNAHSITNWHDQTFEMEWMPNGIVPEGHDYGPCNLNSAADGVFMAEAREDVPWMLSEIREALAIVDLARRLIRSSALDSTDGDRAGLACDEEPYMALVTIFEAEEEAARAIPGLVCAECDRPIYKGQAYAGKGGHAAHKACRNWPAGTPFKTAGERQ